MLRITGGALKGTKIQIPRGDKFRPTLAKPREALFNVICNRFDITEFAAVDLFAGSGILGIECISRGAAGAQFIETDFKTVSLIKKNIKTLHLEEKCRVHYDDAFKWLRKSPLQKTKTLFLADPPYRTGLAQEILQHLADLSGIPAGSLLVLESFKKQSLMIPEKLDHFQHKSYGLTNLDFFEFNESGTP